MRRLLSILLLALLAADARAQVVTGGVTSSGGGGSAAIPGGSDTQCQFNDSSSFGGDAGCTFNKTSNVMTVGGLTTALSAITGGTATGLTAFGIRSTGAAFDVKLANTEVLTADRTLTLSLGNAARTITVFGSTTLPVITQNVTFAGPTAARTYTLVDADHTFAFATASQTYSGNNVYNGVNQRTNFVNDSIVSFGTSDNTGISFRTELTPDSLIIALPSSSNSLHLMERGDAYSYDFQNCSASTSAGTDPFLCIHSHSQSATEWIDFKHDGTNGVIGVGTGTLIVPAGTAGSAAGLAFSGATGLGFTTRNNNKIDIISGTSTIASIGSGLAGANGIVIIGTHNLQWANSAGGTPDLSLGRENLNILQIGVDVNGAAVHQTFKAHDGITGTDIAGANLTLGGGTGTGTGAGGNVITQTSPSLATGTTQQTAVSRMIQVAKPKALTAGSATAVVLFAVASSTVGGGEIEYTVTANDSTDFQVRAGRVGYVMVNKGGTETCKVFGIDSVLGVAGTENPNQTQDASGIGVMSSGTLTYTWGTDVTGTNSCALTLNAASSLTETTLEIAYTVFRQHGTGAITPQ